MASMSGAAQSDALKALSYKAAVYRLTRILKQRQKRLDRSYIVLTLALISIVVIVLLAVLDQIDRAAAITLVVGAVAVALNAAFSSLSAGEPSQKELKGLLKGFGFNAVSASELKRFHEQAKRFARDEAALAQLRQALLQANKPMRDLHSLRDVINGSSAPTSEALKILCYNAALCAAVLEKRSTDEEIYACFEAFHLDRPAAHELEIFRVEVEHFARNSLIFQQLRDALQSTAHRNDALWRMMRMPLSMASSSTEAASLERVSPELDVPAREAEAQRLGEEEFRTIHYEPVSYKAAVHWLARDLKEHPSPGVVLTPRVVSKLGSLLRKFGFEPVSTSEIERFYERARRFATNETAFARLREALLRANERMRDLQSLSAVIDGLSAPTLEVLKVLRYNAALCASALEKQSSHLAHTKKQVTDEEIYACFEAFHLDLPTAHKVEIFRIEVEHLVNNSSSLRQLHDTLRKIKLQNCDLWSRMHVPPSHLASLMLLSYDALFYSEKEREPSDQEVKAARYEAALYKAAYELRKSSGKFYDRFMLLMTFAIPTFAVAVFFVAVLLVRESVSVLLSSACVLIALLVCLSFLAFITSAEFKKKKALEQRFKTDRYIYSIFEGAGLGIPTTKQIVQFRLDVKRLLKDGSAFQLLELRLFWKQRNIPFLKKIVNIQDIFPRRASEYKVALHIAVRRLFNSRNKKLSDEYICSIFSEIGCDRPTTEKIVQFRSDAEILLNSQSLFRKLDEPLFPEHYSDDHDWSQAGVHSSV